MKTLSDKTVLVVDDDVRMLRALDRALSGEGAHVTTAQWAGEALKHLNACPRPVDLVITDLRMPHVSGLTAVADIHRISPALPIIVLTAFGSPYVKAECLRQGAAAFLEKPLDTAALVGAIWEIFSSGPSGPGSAPPGPEKKAETSI